MAVDLSFLLQNKNKIQASYTPDFFRITNITERNALKELIESNPTLSIHDQISSQLKELVKINNPDRKLTALESDTLINIHLGNSLIENYGVWVYYSWSNRLVHILDESEFVALRTSRNIYKIKPEERDILSTKSIGIIGLSVGQSIALTLAMERVCSELRLADFDDLELTNMNRIRTGVHNLGVLKVIIAAREIAELDPFIKVKIFKDGLTPENIDEFFLGGKKLDILVEECDGLDIKILSRLKAKEFKIPVVMDTNDRGMLDIERFDLEPDRPLLHGALPNNIDLTTLNNLTNEEKLPMLDAMVDFKNLSERMKYSLSELGKSITTWPQLASSVILGGAMVTDTCRRILLDQLTSSGRYYIDFEDLIK